MALNAKTVSAIRRENRLNRLRSNKYEMGSMLAQIIGVSSFSEQARVTGFPTRVVIQHPFLSISSWIRGVPEIGTPLMVEYNQESNEAVHTGYRQLDPEQALRESAEGSSLYQELLPGELESLSSGFAHSFKSSRPVDVREAGLIKSILDGDTSTLINRSVTYVDILHQHEVATIKDTRRLGVVRRPKNAVETQLVRAPTPKNSLTSLLDSKPFAKENTLVLMSGEDYLLDFREGNVIEDDGTEAICSWTGNDLRVRKRYYTSEQSYINFEIDSLGNVDIAVPEEAENGFRCFIKGGSAEVNVEKDIIVSSTGDSLYKASDDSTFTIQSGEFVKEISKTISITAGDNITETSDKDITVQAGSAGTASFGGFLTSLGQDGKASHPLLYGDDFIQAFMQLLISLSTHVHPGISVPSPDLATACINLASKCPTFVSTNVQTQ